MNNIRQLTKDEYPKAIELSWQVFTITGKEDFNNEGLEFFKSFIYNKKCINEIIFYGSFDNEALTGILGIKSNGKHISLFFIKPEYHRHGLGKKLFHYASTLHPSIETTVNSSTYAIPFYQSLGFAVVGEKQNYHGLCSTPMRRYHAVFVQKNKYTLRTWQTEDAHSLVQELNNKMAGGDYNGITKACDEGFYDMYDNKKGSLSANLCALRLGLEPRTL